MLWALGLVESLGSETQCVDPGAIAGLLRPLGRAGLLEKARLRPQSELLDAHDRAYRLYWAVVDAGLRQHPAPGGLIPPLVMNRFQAFGWLADAGWDWDEVPLDT